ncbi:MAG: laccase domain-containing protein [Eggerthellaceae bacterium]|nr:laccase domain-containing protein [Eggerthellaceae bacterium]
MSASILPMPSLSAREVGSLHIITDDALARISGVRVAFTGAVGGVSEEPYSSLNLATHVGDNPEFVLENRARLMRAFDAEDVPLVVPSQVHGSNLVVVSDADQAAIEAVRAEAGLGADAVAVEVADVAALLCFADCVPVIIVSPTGRFAVVHAGWRGAVAKIASKAVLELCRLDACDSTCSVGSSASIDSASSVDPSDSDDMSCSSDPSSFADPAQFNVYIGPHIHGECFECGEDVRTRFAEAFGQQCLCGSNCVSLFDALVADLISVGVDEARIVDSGVCTMCESPQFYSYRASGGTCGRHGALAFRRM